MHILITNDDGYAAAGIDTLTQEPGEATGISVVALESGRAAVLPMRVDLTRHRGVSPLQQWLDAV